MLTAAGSLALQREKANKMPYDEVMHKFRAGKLRSGSASGPKVHDRKQAIAIMLSEKQKADEGKKEYQPKKKKSMGERMMER